MGRFCAWQLARYNKQNNWVSSFTRNFIGARMTVWTETKQQEYSKNLRSAVLLLLSS